MHYAPEQTGNAPYTTALAEGLIKLGHSVRVITAHPHYPEWRIREGYGRFTSHECINGVSVTRLRHFVPKSPSNLLRLVSEISFGLRLMIARWGSPDVVLLVSPALFSSALALTRARVGWRRPPVGVWVQDLYSLGLAETGTGGGSSTAVVRWIESALLQRAHGIAAIHERFKSAMKRTLAVDPASVTVIRNWTHLPEPPVFDREAERRKHGWGTAETVVLHAGNMGVKQGLTNVVEAARIADERGLPIRFVLMGDGNQRSRLEQISIGLKSLQFIDPLPNDDFQAALLSADVLLVNELSGIAEMSVPSKLTSYFSTGLPVLGATDAGSVTAAELRLSGGGLRVNSDAPAALIDGVSQLRSDPALRASMGEAGRKHCNEVLTESAALKNFERWLTGIHQHPRG